MLGGANKKNILFYVNEDYYGGGEAQETLGRYQTGSSSTYRLDTHLNWYNIVDTYGGIEVKVKYGGWVQQCPFVVGSDYFNFSSTTSGGVTTFNFHTSADNVSFTTSTYSATLTAILQAYKSGYNLVKHLTVKNPEETQTWGTGSSNGGFFIGSGSNPIYLFSGAGSNFPSMTAPNPAYYEGLTVKSYDGNHTLFDGIPWSDGGGRGCMYDYVSGKYFYARNRDQLVALS